MSLKLEDVSYIYNKGTEMEVHALSHINLEIEKGSFVGIIGHTGSGKSTLVQHFNGLIEPSEGIVSFEGRNLNLLEQDELTAGKRLSKRELKKKRKELALLLKKHRSKVGLVFQYPEHQLFEMDILSDVKFGPSNLSLSEEEIEERAKKALSLVGLDETYYERSPFDLSGGQKRRVAIAGVLALNPEVLILDEPTAGLDPAGREEILELITRLRDEVGMTVILVSHSMDDVAEYVDRIIVMNKAEVAFDDTPREVFKHYKELENMGLSAPQMTYIMHDLAEAGFDVDTYAITIEEACDSIMKNF